MSVGAYEWPELGSYGAWSYWHPVVCVVRDGVKVAEVDSLASRQ